MLILASIHKAPGSILLYDHFPGFPHKRFLWNLMVRVTEGCASTHLGTYYVSMDIYSTKFQSFCRVVYAFALRELIRIKMGKLGEVFREKAKTFSRDIFCLYISVVTTSIFSPTEKGAENESRFHNNIMESVKPEQLMIGDFTI
ncbi:hypothetical protein H8356DRAFT_1421327 [Neocallimastix lanati (nom. inval.)]|nr:hypothetical protein H8356DRAFT_1421327 [Neocallimastix sp. JGI-2020a]